MRDSSSLKHFWLPSLSFVIVADVGQEDAEQS
jgi:hypothetical protein